MSAWPDGLGEVVERRPLAGGDTATTELVLLADGRRLVLKSGDAPARLEADGLRALAAVGAPVPEVVHVAGTVLVLTHVAGTPDWAELGRRLAAVHGAATGDAFGWHEDNRLGPCPQDNRRTPDWQEFLVTRRIEPHARAARLPDEVRRRLDRLVDEVVPSLTAHGPVPSLVHGDLWPGNVVDGSHLVDPAVHHADAEYDLAVARLFGGVPAAFHDAYHEVREPADGWRERLPLLQLPHLLLHVRAFGGSWLAAVDERLRRLGV